MVIYLMADEMSRRDNWKREGVTADALSLSSPLSNFSIFFHKHIQFPMPTMDFVHFLKAEAFLSKESKSCCVNGTRISVLLFLKVLYK